MPEDKKLYLPVRPVNLEFMAQLEVLDASVYPLPGGSAQRKEPDPRLHIDHPKDSDVLTFYEHLASVRHKPSGKIFVAFRETMDALMGRQQNPERYPAWIFNEQVKQTELRIHIYQVTANPKTLAKSHGVSGQTWFFEWLAPVEDEGIHESLVFYLMNQKILDPEMYRAA